MGRCAMSLSASEELLEAELVGKNGKIPAAQALEGKDVVMIYFSAHWCPPCRGFTPQLAERYGLSATDMKTEIIFASSDKDQASFDEYYGEMPWLAIPFGDELKERLGKQFEVKGIPCLIVLNKDGSEITRDGRQRLNQFLPGQKAEKKNACCTLL